MRVLDQISMLLFLMVGVAEAKGLQVQRKEDELLLPPYIQEYTEGHLNVRSEKLADHHQKRSVKAGEWLEYGDAFTIPLHINIEVLMNEGMQWVAGGGFDGKITGGKWDTSKTACELEVKRGMVRVWAKPAPFSGTIQIKTPHVEFGTKQAVFWLLVGKDKTEAYVESGELNGSQWKCGAGQYCEGSKTSQSWNPATLDQKIAALYPDLVKLSLRANGEWQEGKNEKKYSELRSKGWIKTDRFFPSPTPEK